MIVRNNAIMGQRSIAMYSDCERYRYLLRREWNSNPGWLFIGCNPSTATELANDPTIERMQRRAMNAGAGSLSVCNVYALRSTDPNGLFKVFDPNGPENDLVMRNEIDAAHTIICGWGNHRALRDRAPSVMELIVRAGKTPLALGLNKDGTPRHPLYVSYARDPLPMVAA